MKKKNIVYYILHDFRHFSNYFEELQIYATTHNHVETGRPANRPYASTVSMKNHCLNEEKALLLGTSIS